MDADEPYPSTVRRRRASTTSDNEPHRDIGTTSYVATTHRTEKFGKLVRAEFGRTPRPQAGDAQPVSCTTANAPAPSMKIRRVI